MLSTPSLRCYSRTICCASCSTVQIIDCTNGSTRLASTADIDCDDVGVGPANVCCEMFRQGGQIVEDMSQRVMMPCQEAWISCLTSALCKPSFGMMQQCLRVSLVDDLAGTVRMGDIVEVLGTAAVQIQGSDSNSVTNLKAGDSAPREVLEVDANNITSVVPHSCWLSASPDTAMSRLNRFHVQHDARQGSGCHNQPSQSISLQDLCNLLEETQASYFPAHLCLAMLASAAAVSTPNRKAGAVEAGMAGRRTQGHKQSLHLEARLGSAVGGARYVQVCTYCEHHTMCGA